MFSHPTNQDGDMKMRQQSPEAEGRAWHHGPSLVVDVGVGEVEVALLVEVEFVGEVEGHALGRPPSAVRIGDAVAVAVADGGRGQSVGDRGAATGGTAAEWPAARIGDAGGGAAAVAYGGLGRGAAARSPGSVAAAPTRTPAGSATGSRRRAARRDRGGSSERHARG